MQKSNSFLTVNEIADDMGVNINYIYDLIATDRISHIRIGKTFKIHVKWYLEFLETCKNTSLPTYQKLQKEAFMARKTKREAA